MNDMIKNICLKLTFFLVFFSFFFTHFKYNILVKTNIPIYLILALLNFCGIILKMIIISYIMSRLYLIIYVKHNVMIIIQIEIILKISDINCIFNLNHNLCFTLSQFIPNFVFHKHSKIILFS